MSKDVTALASAMQKIYVDIALKESVARAKAEKSMLPRSRKEEEWRAKLDALWQAGTPACRERFRGFERLGLLRQSEAKKDA